MEPDLERRIHETGKHLFDLMDVESRSVFRKEYWVGKLFDWCMHNEPLKVQMFRFIDVFPYLRTPESVIKHIQEYFSDPALDFPSALERGIKFISPSWMSSRIIARSIGNNIVKMARQFIAGATPQQSLPVLEELRSRGLAFSIDLLGEAVVSESEAEEYLGRYLQLFDYLDTAQKNWKPLGDFSGALDWGHWPRINVSLKASAMYSQFNSCAFEHSIEKSKKRLRPILRKAMEAGAFINLDMEHYSIKNLTLALYRSLMDEPEFRDYPHTGIVIQAYLRDSEEDLRQITDWASRQNLHFTIRLVKGAYWDQEVIQARQKNWPIPVFTAKAETDASFERLAHAILQCRDNIKLACASHNIRSISAVAEMGKDLGATREHLEFQVLYGMGQPVRTALKKAGLNVRVYCPIGEMVQGMSYLVRRLLENTANESFLRQSFSQKLPPAELLRNPADKLREPRAPAKAVEKSKHPRVGPYAIEPLFDWSRAENRNTFSGALKTIRGRFPIPVPLVINGKSIQTEKQFNSTNPNRSEEVVGIISSAGIHEAESAIRAARSAFNSWRNTPHEIRAQYLFKAAAAARRKRFQLAALQVLEVGKTWSEADADVCEAIDYLEYYGREMLRYGQPRLMESLPGETSHLFYEPRGVAVVIAPWNFPMAISTGMSSAAVVTGNTVVYKPASQSPVTGYMIAQVFEEAGLPKGVFNFLPGPGAELGDYLTGHRDVALVAFTGSKNVGLHIIERAYRPASGSLMLKNVIAEMGGKNAIIVDSDADMDEAVVHVLHSAFGYQGQKCSACSRLIVLEENYDRFLDRLKAAAESLNIGPTEFPHNFMGAVIEPSARQKVLDYIEIGKKEASPLLEKGAEIEEGNFVPLSVFTGVEPNSRLAQDEIFGPLLAVIKAKNIDEAMQIANGTEYALTGGLLSRSPANIKKARAEFITGNLYLNRGCTGAVVGRHPFGGFKMSGLGSKAGGPDYLLHFMAPRNIVENTVRRGFAPEEA